jgi:hypothetical protein
MASRRAPSQQLSPALGIVSRCVAWVIMQQEDLGQLCLGQEDPVSACTDGFFLAPTVGATFAEPDWPLQGDPLLVVCSQQASLQAVHCSTSQAHMSSPWPGFGGMTPKSQLTA